MAEKEFTGKIDVSKAALASREVQANIVKGLVMEGAYKIAKDFIDFIESKAKTRKETPKEEIVQGKGNAEHLRK